MPTTYFYVIRALVRAFIFQPFLPFFNSTALELLEIFISPAVCIILNRTYDEQDLYQNQKIRRMSDRVRSKIEGTKV